MALSRYLKYVVAQLMVELWRWISVGALVFSGGSVERGNLTPDGEALIYFGSPLGRADLCLRGRKCAEMPLKAR